MKNLNIPRLFNASCVALVVTALTFAIRANLMGAMGDEFALSKEEVGQAAAAAFWGFTIAMFVGGAISDVTGLKVMYNMAFGFHICGIILTMFAQGFWSLFLSTLLVGIGNGFVESASYSMITSIYSTDKTGKINRWHIWFPAGIVMGGLIAFFCNILHFNWRVQMAIMILPTILYGFMFLNQDFPLSERVNAGVDSKSMVRECFKPLFIFMMFCMLLTSATELGTNQWIAELLSAVGVPSILLLVFINGIMTIGRSNAGFILKKITTPKLLFVSAVLSCTGLIWLGNSTGYTSFAAAGVFAIGICFFWPTMIGFVSEQLPKSGALGLSLMGGTGLLSTSLVLPIYGKIYQNQINIKTAELGLHLSHWVKFEAGAKTLLLISIVPGILILAFAWLAFIRKGNSKVELLPAETVLQL